MPRKPDDDGGDAGQDLDDGLDDLPDPPMGHVREVGGDAEPDGDGDDHGPSGHEKGADDLGRMPYAGLGRRGRIPQECPSGTP